MLQGGKIFIASSGTMVFCQMVTPVAAGVLGEGYTGGGSCQGERWSLIIQMDSGRGLAALISSMPWRGSLGPLKVGARPCAMSVSSLTGQHAIYSAW